MKLLLWCFILVVGLLSTGGFSLANAKLEEQQQQQVMLPEGAKYPCKAGTEGNCIDLDVYQCSVTPLIGYCLGGTQIRCCQGEISLKGNNNNNNNIPNPLGPTPAPFGGEFPFPLGGIVHNPLAGFTQPLNPQPGLGSPLPQPNIPAPTGATSVLPPADGGAVETPTISPGRKCPDDMVQVNDFCIDVFEAPNKQGVPPFACSTALDGELWCTNKGKQLCSVQQWQAACKGGTSQDFPYGSQYQQGVCNDDKIWKVVDWAKVHAARQDPTHCNHLYQGEPAGHRPKCVSPVGVYDLTGSVREWVRTSSTNTNNWVMIGCFWNKCFKGVNPTCSAGGVSNHPGTFRSYETGFRCCRPLAD